jgi:hypothetical protein
MNSANITPEATRRISDDVRKELLRLSTGRTVPFVHIIEKFADAETYYASSANVIVRILRANGRDLGTRPAHIQFYDFHGYLITECTKLSETSSAFLLRKFDSELIRSDCYELSGRPSFIPIPNVKEFFDVVPRDTFSVTKNLGLSLG